MPATVIDELIAKLRLDASDYKKGADEATQANKKIRDSADTTATDLESAGKKAGSFWTAQRAEILGVLAVVAGGYEALKAFVDLTARVSTAGGEKGFFAQTNNADPARLSGLESLAKQYGSTAAAADSATASIAAMQRQMMTDPMGAANNPMLQVLRYLGINTGSLNHPRDSGAVLEDLDVKLRSMPRDQAMALAGQAGLDPSYVNSVLAAPGAPDNFTALVKQWQTITDAETEADKKYVTAVGQFDTAVTRFDNDLTTKLLPPLTSLVNALTAIVNYFDGGPGAAADAQMTAEGGYVTPAAKGPTNTSGWPDWLYNRLPTQEQVESADKESAVSPKGAIGVMQLEPGTAEMVAKANGIPWDPNRLKTDVGYNQQLGLLYMQQLEQQFQGNEQETYAAYNAGPGAVESAINQYGPNWLAHMPRETQAYVAKITGSPVHPAILAAAHAQATAHALPAHVDAVLARLRANQAQGKANVTQNITVNGASDPKGSAKAVTTALNTLGLQSMSGLA